MKQSLKDLFYCLAALVITITAVSSVPVLSNVALIFSWIFIPIGVIISVIGFTVFGDIVEENKGLTLSERSLDLGQCMCLFVSGWVFEINDYTSLAYMMYFNALASLILTGTGLYYYFKKED